jgi:phage tail-like protein
MAEMHVHYGDTMTNVIQEPTFLPLNERSGWRTDERASKNVSVGAALRLPADPTGPLNLGWPDGSLGGLTLPRGFALDDEGNLYMLAPRKPWTISRFDSEKKVFVPLPGVGGRGTAARQFLAPRNIAIAGRSLLVADRGNRRVQVFDLTTLVLLHVWAMPPTRKPHDRPWRPFDVAVFGTTAYILDSRNRRVYRQQVGTDELKVFIDGAAHSGRWQRIAVDHDGRVYVLDMQNHVAPRLLIYDVHGIRVGDADDAGAVRDHFDPPAIRLFSDGRQTRSYFCMPASLARQCDRQLPSQSLTPETPLALCPPWLRQTDDQNSGLIFDRFGNRAYPDPSEFIEHPLYQTEGTWFSQPLNSTIFRCQWHRVELEIDNLPPGTQVDISTYTSDAAAANPPPALSPLWSAGYTAVGQLQPPSGPMPTLAELAPEPPAPPPGDFLVQSRQGQYLWLMIRLRSDGFGTPALRGLRVHFPRESYLQYLPAIYSTDETSRWFLERYLSIFQTEWDDLERRISTLPALFDSEAVPAGLFLDALAQRFGLPIERQWSDEQRRTLLLGMRDFYTRRGTAAGLRAYLQAYLQNMSGLTPAEQNCYPLLTEGWRERRRLELAPPDEQASDALLRLWSPSEVGRLHIGAYARVGQARLVDTGDPPRDIFHAFAHRFRVYVPSAWVRTAAAERMLRRALEAEKPAHVAYELCLVEARFRVGVQSTIGFDTILGDYPQARLACPNQDDQELPPSRAPRYRLGYDMVLGGVPQPGPSLPLKM